MITDPETNVVYISNLLEPRYSGLVESLRAILSDHGIPLKVIQGTREIWCRDFMPVQLGTGEFVQFHYKPDYLKGYEQWRTIPSDIEPLPEVERCATSEIVLDGGNVVGWGGRCIVTDKVVRENPGIGRGELLGTLRDLLRVEDLIVIPSEPYDVLGHADGVVRFLDEGIVVINDYSKLNPSYEKRLKSVLRRARLRWVEVPYRPIDGQRGELPPAFGNYVNFLRVGDLVILPDYGITEDKEARRIIEQVLSGTAVAQVDCSGLSMEGGALHCVTWIIES
jgi:agmatine deiminase